ncbi:MAG TPA: helix-turn-helix domain-containing protein [Polyangiaceae bacterium]|jgi:AraC family transcriptional regulator of arabinose operon
MASESFHRQALDPGRLPPRKTLEAPVEQGALLSGMAKGQHLTVRTRGCDTWLLFYGLEGRGFFRSPSDEVVYAPTGSVSLYAPHTAQEYGPLVGEHWKIHWSHFIARQNWLSWLKLLPPTAIPGLSQIMVEHAPTHAHLVRTFGELHRCARLGGIWWTEYAMNALERILLHVCQNLKTEEGHPTDPRIRAAMEWIAARPNRTTSVGELARRAHLSSSRFAHLFREQTGRTVSQVIRRTRLEESARMLETGSSTVADVAGALGFASPFHFSRQFKSQFGLSPTEHRARARGAMPAP